ncbi:MAG: hypothetical protein GY820_25920 [Gammaproteobacteria bacterium]|nr:hypothetical protein [Gammaproteobacteria bacterium]
MDQLQHQTGNCQIDNFYQKLKLGRGSGYGSSVTSMRKGPGRRTHLGHINRSIEVAVEEELSRFDKKYYIWTRARQR